MTDDLWAEASASHEGIEREAALARAEADFEGIFPFLAPARTAAEFAHRLAIAGERLESIADRNGLPVEELAALAARRWVLMTEALAEGQDPLAWVPDGGGYGSGPEEPDEHSEGPDFSHGYSEVPQGPPGGPDPQVTQVRPPAQGPVQEATGMSRQADASALPPPAPTPPQPAGGSAGPAPANIPAGATPDPTTVPQPSPAGQVTSRLDPVHGRVRLATAAIASANPQLPSAECERVARVVVGRYLMADLSSSVIDDDPDGGTGPEGHGGDGKGGMSGLEEAGVARGLISAAPEMLAAL
jgi:hypothetical protein